MRHHSRIAVALVTCALTAIAIPPSGADAAKARSSSAKAAKAEHAYALLHKRHRQRAWPIVPIGPNYTGFEYALNRSRGFYPTHIGPGYIYPGQIRSCARRHHAADRGC